jgi:hypothetical protein
MRFGVQLAANEGEAVTSLADAERVRRTVVFRASFVERGRVEIGARRCVERCVGYAVPDMRAAVGFGLREVDFHAAHSVLVDPVTEFAGQAEERGVRRVGGRAEGWLVLRCRGGAGRHTCALVYAA